MARPLSAQHSKPAFGEFQMNKKLDIIPKVTNYRIDGTGRDSYIGFNNGGNIKESSNIEWCKYTNRRGLNQFSTKNYNVISKVSIYKSDGNGRDQYIVKDCGGFYKIGQNSFNTFKTSLRSYDVKPTKIILNDFSTYCKGFQTNKERERKETELKSQRVLSVRLSAPKKR